MNNVTNVKCPTCGHLLRYTGAGDIPYICSARGGCGSEWWAEVGDRYIVREHDEYPGWFGVFDTLRAAWPGFIDGRKIQHLTDDRAAAEEDAAWLNERDRT